MTNPGVTARASEAISAMHADPHPTNNHGLFRTPFPPVRPEDLPTSREYATRVKPGANTGAPTSDNPIVPNTSPLTGPGDTPQVVIRPAAAPADFEAARALLRAYKAEQRLDICFNEFEAELARLDTQYGPPGGAVLVAFADAAGARAAVPSPFGCVALHAIGSERLGVRVCEMKRLYVLPDARGRRAGLALAHRVIDLARELGYGAMRLDTLPSMTAAIAMYRRLGFREIHPYCHNPAPGVLFLELDLRARDGAPAGAHATDALLRIEIADPDRAIDAAALARLRNHAVALEGHLASCFHASGGARVRIVRDDAMAEAHERHAGVPGTTDVLTFDLRTADAPDASNSRIDADILVCADEARRQAALRRIPIEHELLLYILHGVLHTLGHDDHDDDAFARMHGAEDEILRAIGLAPVFGAPEKPDSPDPV